MAHQDLQCTLASSKERLPPTTRPGSRYPAETWDGRAFHCACVATHAHVRTYALAVVAKRVLCGAIHDVKHFDCGDDAWACGRFGDDEELPEPDQHSDTALYFGISEVLAKLQLSGVVFTPATMARFDPAMLKFIVSLRKDGYLTDNGFTAMRARVAAEMPRWWRRAAGRGLGNRPAHGSYHAILGGRLSQRLGAGYGFGHGMRLIPTVP